MLQVPFVSFCISTFRRGVILKDTLNSIKKQTFHDFEVVISDNDPECSGKAIVEMMEDERFKYFSNGENLGMIQSFNKSIERSRGKYIVMMADDDPVYSDMLETLNELHSTYPGYGMYLGGCDWFCTHHEVGKLYGLKVGTNSCLSNERDLNYTEAFGPDDFVKSIFTFKIFTHYLWSTGMVKRDVLIERGGVPDYGTPFLGDYAYVGIMGSHSGCVTINRSLGCQTLHKANFGRNQNEQLVVTVKKFPEYLEEKMSYLKEWPVIKQKMLHFVGVWVVSHLAFLNKYVDDKTGSLKKVQREIFSIGFMKRFRFKFFIKKNFPEIHNQLVALNQRRRK